jgi:hypothetical protein
MQQIILLLAAYLVAKYLPKPTILRRKPFNCPLCLTFWTQLTYQVCNYTSLFNLIFVPLALALVAAWIEQANDKYLLR